MIHDCLCLKTNFVIIKCILVYFPLLRVSLEWPGLKCDSKCFVRTGPFFCVDFACMMLWIFLFFPLFNTLCMLVGVINFAFNFLERLFSQRFNFFLIYFVNFFVFSFQFFPLLFASSLHDYFLLIIVDTYAYLFLSGYSGNRLTPFG